MVRIPVRRGGRDGLGEIKLCPMSLLCPLRRQLALRNFSLHISFAYSCTMFDVSGVIEVGRIHCMTLVSK